MPNAICQVCLSGSTDVSVIVKDANMFVCMFLVVIYFFYFFLGGGVSKMSHDISKSNSVGGNPLQVKRVT